MSKVPRRMSFFWVGRMSWLRWLTIDTFVRLNPNWEVHLYTAPQEMVLAKHWKGITDDDNSYRGPDYWDRIHSSVKVITFEPPAPMAAAQMCDLFQWKLLSSDGGMYADVDILWLRPMDDVISSLLESDVLLCLESGILAIGLVGSSPNCPLFQHVFKEATVEQNSDYQHYGTKLLYRVFGRQDKWKGSVKAVLRNMRSRYSDLFIVEMPYNAVYPFDWRETHKIFEESNLVPPESLGLHWFGGCSLSNCWNDILTEENRAEHKNTFTGCLDRLEEFQR